MRKFIVRWPFYVGNLERWYFVGEVIEEGSEAYEILKNVPDLLEPVEENKEGLKVVKTEEKKNGRKKSN